MDELLERLEDNGAEVEDTLDRLMGDEELYIEYLKKLKENQNIGELRKAVDNKDVQKALNEVHTLKGVALNLGLLSLVDITMDMLIDFREGRPDEGFSLIDEVEETFNEWVTLIG